MERGVVAAVGMRMESRTASGAQGSARSPERLRLSLLGPMQVERDGARALLPPSRKVRATIAYLALASRATTRSHLCELLWDVPDDPRGELRWCLSKARTVLCDDGRARIVADADAVRLDLTDVRVDALEVHAAVQSGVASFEPARLRSLVALFRGEFLEGLEIPRSGPWSAWLVGQRRRFRAAQAAILEHLASSLDPAADERIACLEQWLRLAPFDRAAHAALLDALARQGRLREGEEHLEATARMFDADGQDWSAIGRAWRDAKTRNAAGAAASLHERDTRDAEGDAHAEADVQHALAGHAAPGAEAAAAAQGRLAAHELPGERPAGGPQVGAAHVARTAQAVGAGTYAGTAASLSLTDADAVAAPARRASIAVMPFADGSPGVAVRGGLGDGLAHDIITRLAKLRSLFVIAQGTVFALDQRRVGPDEAGRTLDVDYVVSGALRRDGARVRVTVQLVETRTARVAWADEYDSRLDATLDVLDRIGDRIVSSVASQIEAAERNRAILKPPGSLDAWEAYHRGLWHMVRFEREHNEQARHFFETAVRLDPAFARPHAGLSFTHFQDAFLGWAERGRAVELAYRCASHGLMADDRDPAAHWALGRALWLRGRVDESLAELDTSIELSPNFALGHYTLAFVHAQSRDAGVAIRASDHSRDLSPYDPLLFAMLATRALALTRMGRHDEAAEWALKAVARPNAHVHILTIAAHCLARAGRIEEARGLARAIAERAPGYGIGDFLTAFRLADDAAAAMRQVAATIEMR
jgi:TolB-like protein/DNA-binding SARP family transcriptional activator